MDGIGWFTLETFTRIAKAHSDHQFFFLFDRKPDKSFHFPSNVTLLVLPPVTRLPFLLQWWHRISVPLALQWLRPDLYISPDFFLPPSITIPSLVTIHDLNFEHFPEFIPRKYRPVYQSLVRISASKASHITTVSEFSKQDIINTYAVADRKIDVVFSGLNSFLTPIEPGEIAKTKTRFGTGEVYFLVSGSLHPRKNPVRVVEAFARFRQITKLPYKLVFAGNVWKDASMELKKCLEGHPFRDEVIFTGRVSDYEMNALFRGAVALVFASLYEGFGLPLLEASAAGIPVITSANSSMQEIGGSSSLLVDPDNVVQIADAMTKLAADAGLRQKLTDASKDLIRIYTWDRTAILMWESMKKACPDLV
jgi:glycosyltransferase involved in cell wall biosynthesis